MATSSIGVVQIPRCGSVPCVCGTCTCGRHHCPGVVEKFPFDGSTTYKVQYTRKTAEVQRPFAPSEVPIVTPAPTNHFLTTNDLFALRREEYSPSRQDRATPIKPQVSLQRPQTPFKGISTQKVDFPNYGPVERVHSAPPRRAMEPIQSTFGVYETTNRAMQGPVANAMRQSSHKAAPVLQQTTLVSSGATLEARTTYRDFYPAKRAAYERYFRARPQLMPAPSSVLDDRDFRTTKSIHFPAYRVGPGCPAAAFSRRPPSGDGHISIKAL